MTALDQTSGRDWFKSSRSADNAACVEVRIGDGAVDVRDSKDRGGPVLTFDAATWSGFVGALRVGVIRQP